MEMVISSLTHVRSEKQTRNIADECTPAPAMVPEDREERLYGDCENPASQTSCGSTVAEYVFHFAQRVHAKVIVGTSESHWPTT